MCGWGPLALDVLLPLRNVADALGVQQFRVGRDGEALVGTMLDGMGQGHKGVQGRCGPPF